MWPFSCRLRRIDECTTSAPPFSYLLARSSWNQAPERERRRTGSDTVCWSLLKTQVLHLLLLIWLIWAKYVQYCTQTDRTLPSSLLRSSASLSRTLRITVCSTSVRWHRSNVASPSITGTLYSVDTWLLRWFRWDLWETTPKSCRWTCGNWTSWTHKWENTNKQLKTIKILVSEEACFNCKKSF